jgi:hypothetical protein
VQSGFIVNRVGVEDVKSPSLNVVQQRSYNVDE